MQATTLSGPALSLLRRRWADERVAVTDRTLPLYRELAAAGLMYPVSGFAHGPESSFRFTEAGWAMLLIEAAGRPAGSP